MKHGEADITRFRLK